MGIPEQAGRDAQPLAHAHGVRRHLVVGAVKDADTLERRPDAALGRRLTRRRQDLQVLATGQMAVEAGLVDDGADAGQRHVRGVVGTLWPSSDMVPESAWVRPSSTRISVVLPAPFGPE